MAIRILALYLLVAVLCLYAWKDWFKSLCALIVMMAIIHHEDMPTNIYGIQGFNTWNVLFAMVFLSWVASRCREGLRWVMPRHMTVLLLIYLAILAIGFVRALPYRSQLGDYPFGKFVSDLLINPIKWVLPGILLFDGCRTRNRAITALACVLVMYLLTSAQVIKQMPFEAALGSDGVNMQDTRLRVCTRLGYSSCDLSAVLAGASWGMLAALQLVRKKRYWALLLAGTGMIAFGQALTGGRAGYVAWGATGLTLCLLKWRKQLILAPVIVILLPILFPSAADRMLHGFGQTDATGQATADSSTVTSGRTLIWPLVIERIGESPLIGYGPCAMQRTGLSNHPTVIAENFPHPHNLYLETLLHNGILGALPIFAFWGAMVLYAARLFRSRNRLHSAVGGLALALMLAQLFAGLGAQHYYPRESTLCVWVAAFLSLRVYVEESRAREGAIAVPEASGHEPVPLQQAVTSAG